MTNTKIINAGALLAAGSDRALAVKVTLPASTKEFTLEGIVTNGASSEASRILPIEINFATSNLDGVADTVATSLSLFAEGKRAQLKHTNGLLTFIRSKPFVPTGSLLYAWIQHSALPANAAIDLWLNTVDDAAFPPPTPSLALKSTFVRGLKAPAATNTPEALAAAGTYVSSVTIWAQRAARVVNVGSVFIDSVSPNDTQLIELTPGAYVVLNAPPGKFIDLGDIYVDSVTLTDGVFFLGMV